MNVFLFILLFLYTANWGRLKLLIQGIGKPKSLFSAFTNKRFLKKVNKKVGLEFEIKVQNSPWIYGYSPSTPFKPVFIISNGAVSKLTEDELEWLALHEMGHCIMWHIVKETVIHITLLIIGAITIYSFHLSMTSSILSGILVGLVWYQIERIFEYHADTFALNKIDNPSGMIGANEKMRQNVRSIFYKNSLLTFFFTPHLTYDQRIAMAQRKNSKKK